MSSIFSDDALHPGRDPNDSSWKILRRPHDWAGATFRDAVYDRARMVIELAPRGLAAGDTGCDTCGPDGMRYRSDPDRDRVLAGPCGCELSPIPHFGGRGTATGKLRRPTGVALDDRGRLYVADTDNHRVQVVRPGDGSVEVVLGATDGWGEPVAGLDGGAMTEPVSIAIAATAIYVADRAGRIHVFDRAFRWLRSFEPRAAARPIAIGVDARGMLFVADEGCSHVLRFEASGELLPALAFDDATVPAAVSCLGVRARFASRGEVVVGPVDGLVEDLAWHRVIVDAKLPAGCRIAVQTFASDEPVISLPISWAPAEPVAMSGGHHGPFDRPVLSDVARWERARRGAYRRATPTVATFRGDGPNGVATLALADEGLARVRAGDTLEVAAGATSERAVVAAVEDRLVRLSATGVVAAFGAGTTIVLLERAGVEPFGGPRLLYTLASGETLDLHTVATDGTLAEVSVPHVVAALWRRGDVISIGTAIVVIDDLASTSATITLAAPLVGDYAHSTVRIVDAVGRLFVAGPLDAAVPEGEPIQVGGLSASTPWERGAQIRWIEADLGAVWLEPDPLFPWTDWETFTTPIGRATDRGRYLWLRVVITGALAHADDATASSTPTIRSVRLLRPRLSYLRYLPATFARRDADDPTGALFLERMLAMFERALTTVESRYEGVSRQLDPYAADPEWLQFVAGWFDLYFDPALPPERRRLLVAEAHALYAARGTPEGMRRYIEIVTGSSPQIVEGFQLRPRSELVLGETGVLGCAALGPNESGALDRHAHQFTIFVFVLDPCHVENVRASMERLVASIKPAHTVVDLRVVVPDARVDVRSTIGIDFVLGDGAVQPRVLGGLVLGRDGVLLSSSSPTRSAR